MGAGMSRNNTRSLILIPLSFAALYLALNPRYNAPPPVAAQTNSFIFTAAGDYGFSSDAAATLQLVGSTSPAFTLALGDLSYSSSRPEAEWCHTDFPGSHFGSRNWQVFRSRVLLVLPGFLPVIFATGDDHSNGSAANARLNQLAPRWQFLPGLA